MARPRGRILTWIIVGWIVFTIVVALGFAAQDQACTAQAGFDLLRCRWEARVGFRAAIGWLVIGTIVLGIVWIITQPRSKTRECPACGSDVRRGVTTCQVCGHDFAAAAAGGRPIGLQPPSPPPPRDTLSPPAPPPPARPE